MSVEPYALRIDGQEEPQGVIASPNFTWRLRSTSGRRGAHQVACRITVCWCTPGGDRVRVWDSGRLLAPGASGVRYQGAPLISSSDYEWSVEVEDDTGQVTTSTARCATGIVHPDEWRAAWIKTDPAHRGPALPPQDTDISYTVNKLQPVRRYVHHFELDEVPVSAKVHASAKGIYRLYVNGRRVGRDELVPGWTEYRDRITYQSWDVTDHLTTGRNSIAALLADGWYVGFIGTDRRHQAQHYGTEPSFLAQLVIDRAEGGRRIVATGEGWKESASDILYADLLMGQYEDSRRADPTWHLPSQDIDSWSDAVIASTDTSRLVPEVDPAVRVTERIGAVTVDDRGGGRFVVDFGQNLVGRLRLTLREQPEGARIQLNHAEVLDERGELYTANLRTAEPVDVFWTDGSQHQVFEPRFTLHGFRYAAVDGYDGVLHPEDVEAVVLHNEFDRLGRFETSSKDINQLRSNIEWGLRGNFVSIPTDCPQRDERLGWVADAQVFAPTALVLRDVAPLLSRWLRDVRSAQNTDGAFPDIAPHLVHLREGAPAWGDGGVTIPWQIYRATGDVRVLEEAVDSMIAWVHHVQRHNPDLIWREQVGNDYGDWLQVGEQTRKDVLATAYFAHSTDLTARTLRVLGHADRAREFDELFEAISRVYRKTYVADDGTVAGDTQGGYLLTLAFGLTADERQQDAVARKLVESVERRGVSLTTGFITVGLLCPVLADIGREDLAFQLLHRDEYPSWLFSIRNGATTIWERWDGWTPEHGLQSPRMNSFNHYSLGSVGHWFFSGILGIRQGTESAGYRDLVLEPRLDPNLEWARGGLESPRGRIESRWSRDEDAMTWTVTIPPGDPATVVVPSADPAMITVDGETATRAAGVLSVAGQDATTRMAVESGTCTFRFPLA